METDFMKMNGYERPSLTNIGGVPFEWFREIDAACDAYFKRKKIKYGRTFKESIHHDIMTKIAKKKERKKFGEFLRDHIIAHPIPDNTKERLYGVPIKKGKQ